MYKHVRQYIDTIYPHCARTGSTEDIGEDRFRMRDGTSWPYTYRTILVLDNNFTGVMYSSVFIVNLPSDADVMPGKWLHSPEMEEAKSQILFMLNMASETSDANVKHATARIFIGGDAVWCKFDHENVKPTISDLASDPTPEFKKENDMIAEAMRQSNIAIDMPVVWDEGPLQFNVQCKPLAEPTRLLVARVFEQKLEKDLVPDEDVDAAVLLVSWGSTKLNEVKPVKLLQSRNPRKTHGNIVGVTAYAAIPMTELWPKFGVYAKSAAMIAAKAAAIELLQTWNWQGKLQRCNLKSYMGADSLRLKYISEHFGSPTPLQSAASLEPFYLHIKEQEEYKLFESEVHMQAAKEWTRRKVEEHPAEFRAMVPQIAIDSAARFLEINYPGYEVSDKGGIPVTIGGKRTWFNDTRLVVAREPNKEKNNMVAAVHVAPLPGDEDMSWNEIMEKNWWGTFEMKACEEVLQNLLVEWYNEGRLAEDCMAMTSLAISGTLYRFVDGERFEDYPEEREAQFKWQ
ncbi:hypothetical protein BU23DRAFT_602750 [Bimuria novae-zelandiae CBS 107.79]|uniref:Uncharacterized protein n=1 Tax=Bimuria novae-zelandiae CBS 107.79 TaxID=1447943 RepID=A0A6A5V2N3_9PLEO|nr:hypothetical protein BU23DRAFT_602750 [Bimuria novae-zelandiae CBS 107.79]